ncbi:alpha/beta hydrolase fold-3 domain-containing protein [Nemania sp. FL0916]|nr:alpha/beta hydrolase fold-3 domain-containing protein [Nemania sp. FL0916]
MPTVTYPGRSLVSYPVINIFYVLFRSGTILARLPFWALSFSLFQGTRPHPSWSFRQSLMLRIATEYVSIISRIEIAVPFPLEPGKEKDRWAKLEPFSKELYSGPLESETVKPAAIGGTWYPKKPTDPAHSGTIVLHIHGGAFVVGSGRTAENGYMADLFTKHGKIGHSFFPQYRLSSRPTSAPFPAALQDALTSYLYLVRTLEIPASNIVVSGDSAGGNLAIALLRYLAEYGPGLGLAQPQCGVIIAPWTTPIKHLWPEIAITSNPNYGTDYLGTDLCRWGAKTYMRGVAADHPYVVHLGNAFSTPVPLLVTFGGGEILAVDGAQWVQEMARVKGNTVESYVEPAAPHDTVLFGQLLGWEDSSAKVAATMGEFIRRHA